MNPLFFRRASALVMVVAAALMALVSIAPSASASGDRLAGAMAEAGFEAVSGGNWMRPMGHSSCANGQTVDILQIRGSDDGLGGPGSMTVTLELTGSYGPDGFTTSGITGSVRDSAGNFESNTTLKYDSGTSGGGSFSVTIANGSGRSATIDGVFTKSDGTVSIEGGDNDAALAKFARKLGVTTEEARVYVEERVATSDASITKKAEETAGDVAKQTEPKSETTNSSDEDVDPLQDGDDEEEGNETANGGDKTDAKADCFDDVLFDPLFEEMAGGLTTSLTVDSVLTP